MEIPVVSLAFKGIPLGIILPVAHSFITPQLACISHKPSTTAVEKPMSAASRSKKALNVATATPPRFFLRAPCSHGLLRRLVTMVCEKCRLGTQVPPPVVASLQSLAAKNSFTLIHDPSTDVVTLTGDKGSDSSVRRKFAEGLQAEFSDRFRIIASRPRPKDLAAKEGLKPQQIILPDLVTAGLLTRDAAGVFQEALRRDTKWDRFIKRLLAERPEIEPDSGPPPTYKIVVNGTSYTVFSREIGCGSVSTVYKVAGDGPLRVVKIADAPCSTFSTEFLLWHKDSTKELAEQVVTLRHLKSEGFRVPIIYDVSRDAIVLEYIDGPNLMQLKEPRWGLSPEQITLIRRKHKETVSKAYTEAGVNLNRNLGGAEFNLKYSIPEETWIIFDPY